jgi:hypothetical protein
VNSTFYVVNSSSTITTINTALAAGENLLFTPGVYSYASTINVTKADTKIIGLGFATLIPTAGQTTISVTDVGGVNISGLILDAGPVNSPTLLTVGTPGSTVPSQAAWMSSATQEGYPAFFIPNSVTTFQGYGMGSYSNFDVGPAIENPMGFQAPGTSGVVFHDVFTIWLSNLEASKGLV